MVVELASGSLSSSFCSGSDVHTLRQGKLLRTQSLTLLSGIYMSEAYENQRSEGQPDDSNDITHHEVLDQLKLTSCSIVHNDYDDRKSHLMYERIRRVLQAIVSLIQHASSL